jgi:hypothetical protein
MSLDRQDFRILGNVLDLFGAGADELTVQDDRAGAADADAAADLDAGQADPAENIRQTVLFRVHHGETVHTVDEESDAIEFHGLPPQ